jgi:D-glycero-alpha-D-manno-heptose-7-phosphate kinase
MIITRTPLRIPLGGGGTDLASYYSKHGGFLVGAGINKYINICVNRRFEESVRLAYSQTEIVDKLDDIQHPIIREVLRLLTIECKNLEIVSLADVPSDSGLGSSSCFTVGLINALQTHKREHLTIREIAEKACKIEIEILHEPIGKQDQYMAAYGGFTCLEFSTTGEVSVSPLAISDETVDELERNLLLFHTGIKRRSSFVLEGQNNSIKKDEKQVVDAMHRIKEIGFETKRCLEHGKPDRFGELLHEHWEVKKKVSNKMSTDKLDEAYHLARTHGALGGKIIGAGGGGFFLFYCRDGREKLKQALAPLGMKPMRFRFDADGTKVVANF